MIQAKKFVFAKRFDGMPKVTDFWLVEETLTPLKDGEVLVEAIYLSVDPYMRPYTARLSIGDTMMGGQIAKVIESKNTDYPVNSNIFGSFGWRTHTIFHPNNTADHMIQPHILPSFGNLPLSLGLSSLGMPGNTAYFGFLDICQPKSGETVVVSGAAGAVGSMVGQIAKIKKGCKVIGIAGSDGKCEWLVNELGFDHAINYKNESVSESLKKYAPGGVDCYFDNVGGGLSSIVINRMRDFGRISVCGSISSYNFAPTDRPLIPILQPTFVAKKLKMEGFVFSQFFDKWFDGIAQMKQLIDDGKLKYKETITSGFENTPQAFIDMLEGRNFGKAVVKVTNSILSKY